jgi:beta-lactamase regulating signal transducer with metallopeptidase domain
MATAFAIALKTSLLMLAIGAVTLLSAHRSAAFRHALWTMALALSLVMPLAVLAVPSLAILPVSWLMPDVIGMLPTEFVASFAREIKDWANPRAPALGSLRNLGSIVWPLWWVGALCFLTRDLVARLALIRWRRRARPLRSAQWATSLRRAAAELELPRPLRVLESPDPAALCTWGFVRPVLLLPDAGDAWPESQRRHALLQERANGVVTSRLSTMH